MARLHTLIAACIGFVGAMRPHIEHNRRFFEDSSAHRRQSKTNASSPAEEGWVESELKFVCADPENCGPYGKDRCRDFGCSSCAAGICRSGEDAMACCEADPFRCTAVYGGGTHWWTFNAPCSEEEHDNSYYTYHSPFFRQPEPEPPVEPPPAPRPLPKHLLLQGCSKRRTPFKNWGLPRLAFGDERAGEALCCNEDGQATRNVVKGGRGLFNTRRDGKRSLSHENCTTEDEGRIHSDGDPSFTFDEALEICTSVGLRLCRNQAELDTSCNTGCFFNAAVAWVDRHDDTDELLKAAVCDLDASTSGRIEGGGAVDPRSGTTFNTPEVETVMGVEVWDLDDAALKVEEEDGDEWRVAQRYTQCSWIKWRQEQGELRALFRDGETGNIAAVVKEEGTELGVFSNNGNFRGSGFHIVPGRGFQFVCVVGEGEGADSSFGLSTFYVGDVNHAPKKVGSADRVVCGAKLNSIAMGPGQLARFTAWNSALTQEQLANFWVESKLDADPLPPTPFHLAPQGSDECDFGTVANEDECEFAATALLEEMEQDPDSSISIGEDASLPSGCSLHSGGDWSINYNTAAGTKSGGHSLVCSGKGVDMVLDGCSASGAIFPKFGEPRMAPHEERAGEAICCNEKGQATRNIRNLETPLWNLNEGTGRRTLSHEDCTTPESHVIHRGDAPSYTFNEANEFCERVGLRLCHSQAELDTSCRTGCMMDHSLAWVSGFRLAKPDSPVLSDPTHLVLDGCSRNRRAKFFSQWSSPRLLAPEERAGEAICCTAEGQATRNIKGTIESGTSTPVWNRNYRGKRTGSNKDCTTPSTRQVLEQDGPSYTFAEAKLLCTAAGLRLCQTQAELDTSCGTGCQFDHALAWVDTSEVDVLQSAVLNLDASDSKGPGSMDVLSQSIWDTPMPSSVVGVKVWNIADAVIHRIAGKDIIAGKDYTHCAWIKWKPDNQEWRTLWRGDRDQSVVTQKGSDELGLFSNRAGGFRGSGYMVQSGSFQCVCVIGKGEGPNSPQGVSTFFVGSLGEHPKEVGQAKGVVSGTKAKAIGWPNQGPGEVAHVTAWNYALSQESLEEYWSLTRLAVTKPDFESRPPAEKGDCAIYEDMLPGDALGGNSHTIVMALEFHTDAASVADRQWLFNIGQSGTGAEHWLWTGPQGPEGVQIGMWDGEQISKVVISGARTIATTYQSGTKEYTLYIDGEEQAQKVVDLDIQSGKMFLGSAGRQSDFHGCVQGVDVYRHALGATQIPSAAERLVDSVERDVMEMAVCNLDRSEHDGSEGKGNAGFFVDAHSGTKWMTTNAEGQVHAGVKVWSLLDGFVQRVMGPSWTVAQEYTHCAWIVWRDHNFGWRSLFRGTFDISIIVRMMSTELGVFSHRRGGFRGSGFHIQLGEQWQLVCVVGKGESPNSAMGVSEFFVGSMSAAPESVGTADRVVSGSHVFRISEPSQGPGYLPRFTAWNTALSGAQLADYWSLSRPPVADLMTTAIAELKADSTRSAVGLTDKHTGSVFNAPVAATNQENNIPVWDLNRGFFRHTGGPRWVVAQEYTHCAWVIWRTSDFGWRTIFHGTADHSIFTMNMGKQLGVFSNRAGGFFGSGHSITADGSLQFVCSVGKGMHAHAPAGTTQFFEGNGKQKPVPVGEELPRVVCGTHVNSMGWPGQGPGFVNQILLFNHALDQDALNKLWTLTNPL